MLTYMFQASMLCEDCGKAKREELTAEGKAPADVDNESTYDSDDFPKGPYGINGNEADSPYHCDGCSLFLENDLTPEGLECVRAELEKQDALVANGIFTGGRIDDWRDFYADRLAEKES